VRLERPCSLWWNSQWKIRGLLADGRCTQAVLGFLAATDVGRRVSAEEDTVSEVSEAELREGEEERRAEAEELGAQGGSYHCSYPRQISWRP